MKIVLFKILGFLMIFSFIQCKENKSDEMKVSTLTKSNIRCAKGFTIDKYQGYSVLKILKPWPKSEKIYTYILTEKNAIIPDSLASFATIQIPIKKLIATSTTHISALEMLGVENSLIGFAGLNYISSEKIRFRIDANKIIEVGQGLDLNTEKILDLNPDLVMGFGIDNKNAAYDNLEKSGLKIIFNGDWNEQSPLGKAEWIKVFGALYGLDKQAEDVFNSVEKSYLDAVKLAKNTKSTPSILCGEMYENIWYTPEGNSWSGLFLRDAKTNYLWKQTTGTGSLSLPFEVVLEKAKKADFWLQGAFSSYKEMQDSNIHYTEFDAFKNKKIYSFGSKKGKTGGIIFYELSGNRPDLVLKDLIKITHPELLPDYKLYFYEPLK